MIFNDFSVSLFFKFLLFGCHFVLFLIDCLHLHRQARAGLALAQPTTLKQARAELARRRARYACSAGRSGSMVRPVATPVARPLGLKNENNSSQTQQQHLRQIF